MREIKNESEAGLHPQDAWTGDFAFRNERARLLRM
jgi:hypothetical protein